MTVLRLYEIDQQMLADFLQQWQLRLVVCDPQQPIPGSFWGDDEAGLIGDQLFAWPNTPLHSIFHEACHFICADESRRRQLHTNAGSDDAEENAVCYLQVLLAGLFAPLGRQRMFADMDSWGYSFRLGSSRAWFEDDAEDALDWLVSRGLLDENQQPLSALRVDMDHYQGSEIADRTRGQQTVASK